MPEDGRSILPFANPQAIDVYIFDVACRTVIHLGNDQLISALVCSTVDFSGKGRKEENLKGLVGLRVIVCGVEAGKVGTHWIQPTAVRIEDVNIVVRAHFAEIEWFIPLK